MKLPGVGEGEGDGDGDGEGDGEGEGEGDGDGEGGGKVHAPPVPDRLHSTFPVEVDSDDVAVVVPV